MSSPRGESALSVNDGGNARWGVSSAATELSLRLSNNFRDVKFDTNCIAACDSHLKQSRVIADFFFYDDKSISRKKSREEAVLRPNEETDKVQLMIYVLKLRDRYASERC